MRRGALAGLPVGPGCMPDPVGRSGVERRGRRSRRGLDARRPAPLDGGSMSGSGSQKRRVTARIAVNCTPKQKAGIVAKCAAAGDSPSAIVLNIVTGPAPALDPRPTLGGLDAPFPRDRVGLFPAGFLRF